MILKNCAISEGSDIVRKLIAAHENMSDGMRMIAERRQTHIHQDLPQGVRPTDLLMRELNKTRTRDMDVLDPILYELKVVFESPNSDGECGVREHEFLSTFGPVFMPGGSPEDLAQWFNNIDYDANGLVEWNEFCSFIMSSRYLDLVCSFFFLKASALSHRFVSDLMQKEIKKNNISSSVGFL